MFAGHVVMGSFAIMASMFMQPLLQQVSAAHAVGALPSLARLCHPHPDLCDRACGRRHPKLTSSRSLPPCMSPRQRRSRRRSSLPARALKVSNSLNRRCLPMEPGSYKKVILREIRHARQRRNRELSVTVSVLSALVLLSACLLWVLRVLWPVSLRSRPRVHRLHHGSRLRRGSGSDRLRRADR